MSAALAFARANSLRPARVSHSREVRPSAGSARLSIRLAFHHPFGQPADARQAEIERGAGLAHREAVLLAEHEQQPALRRGRAAALGGDEALHAPLRDVEQVDQPAVRVARDWFACEVFRR